MKNMNDFFLKPTTAGQIIKAFRENFNITQLEMSEALGVSATNLSAIENNRRDLGVEMATRIGAFLGVHPSIILFPNGHKIKSQKNQSSNVTTT